MFARIGGAAARANRQAVTAQAKHMQKPNAPALAHNASHSKPTEDRAEENIDQLAVQKIRCVYEVPESWQRATANDDDDDGNDNDDDEDVDDGYDENGGDEDDDSGGNDCWKSGGVIPWKAAMTMTKTMSTWTPSWQKQDLASDADDDSYNDDDDDDMMTLFALSVRTSR